MSIIKFNIAAMNITQEQMDLEDQIKQQEEAAASELPEMDWANEMTTDVEPNCSLDDDCEACGS